jgi:hypothetical protein
VDGAREDLEKRGGLGKQAWDENENENEDETGLWECGEYEGVRLTPWVVLGNGADAME